MEHVTLMLHAVVVEGTTVQFMYLCKEREICYICFVFFSNCSSPPGLNNLDWCGQFFHYLGSAHHGQHCENCAAH